MPHRKGPKQQNAGSEWTSNDVARLKQLVKGNTPTRLIADSLGRTVPAIQNKASDLGVSLKPTNQSPYNRRKK